MGLETVNDCYTNEEVFTTSKAILFFGVGDPSHLLHQYELVRFPVKTGGVISLSLTSSTDVAYRWQLLIEGIFVYINLVKIVCIWPVFL